MLYEILEQTPFSLQYYPSESFRPIAEYQLQQAEYDLKVNEAHYYEHVVKVGDRFCYPREIADRIVKYWREKRWFAEYQLREVERTPNTACSGLAETSAEIDYEQMDDIAQMWSDEESANR